MKWNRLSVGIGLVVTSLAAGITVAGPRTDVEFSRLASWSARTSRGRDTLPPVFSIDAQKDAAIRAALSALIQEGSKGAEGICVTDDKAVRAAVGDQLPLEPKLVLRMTLDRKAGRFIASSDKDNSEGLSSSAWFFYENFFTAYAGLNPEFRRCDSPLARGVAALAALNNTARGDLILLPDFKQEAAGALWLLNADPELAIVMRSQGPADEGLRARIAAAIEKALGTGVPSQSQDMARTVLGDSGASSATTEDFDLRAVFGESDSMRDAVWKHALATIPYPGLLAEIGIAAWSGRTMDAPQVVELDRFFESRMMGVIQKDSQLRGVSPDPLSKKAIFDVSELTSIFGFIWTYRPEFDTWRKEACAAASLPGVPERDAKRRGLISELSVMLTSGSPSAVSPAAALCSLISAHPTSSGVVQPVITLDYLERSVKDPRAETGTSKYVDTAQIKLRWQLNRPVLGRGGEAEEIVFSGSASAEAPEGLKTPITKQVSSAPGEGTATAKGEDLKKPGPKPGRSTGHSGQGDGEKGTSGKGKTPAPAPKKKVASLGFAPDTSVLWRSNAEGAPTNAPISAACSNGLAGTMVGNMTPRPGQPPSLKLATVWSEVADAKIIPFGAAVKIELENGQSVVAGESQEFMLFGQSVDPGCRKAKDLQVGDKLMGADAHPVQVKKIEEVKEPVVLINPSMALYKNLLVGGVLAKVGVVEKVGGILVGMQVDSLSGSLPVEKLKQGSMVSAYLEEEAGPVPTEINAVLPKKVNSYAELRYEVDGKERILRIAATQKVLVWIPQAAYQAYACASPELARTDRANAGTQGAEAGYDKQSDPAPSATATNETLTLSPGMMLVTASSGPGQPPRTTALKSVIAVGEPQKAKTKGKEDEGKIETFVPEVINAPLLRVEGVLLHCPTSFENVRGFALDSVVVQPPEGNPPGSPLEFSGKTTLPAIGFHALPCPEGPFLTAKWPEKTWLAGRTKAIPRSTALRCVRIETDRGALFCGNSQILPAVKKGAGLVKALAEELTQDPGLYELLFINREAPRSDGELERIPVRSAKYVYGLKRTALAEIAGDGAAGRESRSETGADGKPVTKLISRDVYFVNGFMALSENEESTSGGGSLSGGGGGPGKIAPDNNVSIQETRVSFNLPGLEAGNKRTRENRLLFKADERAQFDSMLQGLQKAYGETKWGRERVKDEKRFMRFLSLYFVPQGAAGMKNSKQLAALYSEPSTNGAAPLWTSVAFREYIEGRASLLEHGIPSDLYGWSFRYVFLVTLAYETGNTEWGDALLRDYLCITMSVALGRHEEQKNRSQYYDDPRYRLAEALHWSRDIVSIVRDGGDGRQAWVRADGWENLLKANLKKLAEVGGVGALQREDGRVEIGNLWVQLRKSKHGESSSRGQSGLDPELAEQVQAAAAGQDENRTLFLIVSPSQNPAAAFEDGTFREGPYVGKTIRSTLGIMATNPGM